MRFLKIRKALNWSQNDLAKYLGVSRPTITRIENGSSKCREPILKLLKILETKPSVKKALSESIDKV